MLRRIQRLGAVATYHKNLITIAPVEVLVSAWARLMDEITPKNVRITNEMSFKVGSARMEALVKKLSFQQPEFVIFLGVAAHEWAHFLGFKEKKARAFEQQFRDFLGKILIQMRKDQEGTKRK